MKKIKVNKIFVVIIITFLILSLLVYSSIPGSILHSVSSPITFITDPIYTTVSNVSSNITGFFKSITDSESIRKENEKLNKENTFLKYEIKKLEENKIRWEELKDALNIRDKFSDYEIIGANVLTRELGEWFDIFRVGAGIRDNIIVEENTSFAVVDAQMNLVGRVMSSDYSSSKILPILNEGSIVSGKVNSPGGVTMRIRGDIILKEKNQCIVDNVSDFTMLKIGDEVVTSGLGGLFPPGIPIGKVIEIENMDSRIERKAILEIYTDYKMLTDVFIMKGSLLE